LRSEHTSSASVKSPSPSSDWTASTCSMASRARPADGTAMRSVRCDRRSMQNLVAPTPHVAQYGDVFIAATGSQRIVGVCIVVATVSKLWMCQHNASAIPAVPMRRMAYSSCLPPNSSYQQCIGSDRELKTGPQAAASNFN